jgi:DNA-directed RNA polymerase specialized sigma24 family protein
MTSVMTGQAQAALTRLHEQARSTSDNFDLERIDRALDEIVRLNSPESYGRQVRSAMANASKVILDRRDIAPFISLDALPVEHGPSDNQEAAIGLRLWLRDTNGISQQQRRLLMLLADDYDVDAIAAMYRIPAPRMRERISRARKAARAAYDRDMDVP